VVVLAQEEAVTLKHSYIGTEHILLGLLREEEGLASQVLKSLDITVERVRDQIVRIVGSVEERGSGEIPFTPRAKEALQQGLQEAANLGHTYVGTEHLLLGLVHDESGTAAQVLIGCDADAERVRKETMRLLEVGPRGMGRSRPGRGIDGGVEPDFDGSIKVGLTPRARRILQLAAEQAVEAGRTKIMPGDLLEPLVLDETIASVLSHLGVDVDALRERLDALAWTEPEEPEDV
jgi:ATP-dependent Clp protease ATP-binding subunit ClpC